MFYLLIKTIGYATLGKLLSVLRYRAVAALVLECPCPYASVVVVAFFHGKMPTKKGQQQNKITQNNEEVANDMSSNKT